jgi:PAS domain S-box-containing protein
VWEYFVSETQSEQSIIDEVFSGSSEMGRLMRTLNWKSTALGDVEQWSPSLRTAVGILLDSQFPTVIFWGSDFVPLYNDAYRSVFGMNQHRSALGQRGREGWLDVWHVISPVLERVVSSGFPTRSDNQLLILDRSGYSEECYFTFSFSPLRDETGRVAGVFTVVTETTQQVVQERRLRTLHELAARTGETTSVLEVCRTASAVFAENEADLAFTLLYLSDQNGQVASRVSVSGISETSPVSPATLHLDNTSTIDGGWSLGAARSGMIVVDDLSARFGMLPTGLWGEAPRSAVIVPLKQSSEASPFGFFIAALSPRRRLDNDYTRFLYLITRQLIATVANAHANEEQRQRTEALAALELTKSRFFSSLHPQFRAPLTLMLAPLEAILAGASPSSTVESLHLIIDNALHLLELKSTAQASEIERQKLHDFLMKAPAAIAIVHGPDHVYTLVNELYLTLFNRRGQVLLGKSIRQVFPEIEGQGIYEIFNEVFSTGVPFVTSEYPATFDRKGTGELEIGYFNFVAHPMADAEGTITDIFIHAFEVTDQIEARKQVEASEKKLRLIAEALPQKIFLLRADGQTDYLNPQWMEFTGLSFSELKDSGWMTAIHPNDVGENVRQWMDALARGTAFQFEHRLRRADGVYRWHLVRALPMHDDGGNVLMWVGSDTDIDDQKKIQEQKDEFFSVAAHELRSPVTSLRGFAQVLLRQIDRRGEIDIERLQQALRTIDTQSEKLARLISQLMDISRLEGGRLVLERQTVDVARLVGQIIDTLQQSTLDHTFVVRTPTALVASVDPLRLEQVLINLLDNATKYSPPGSSIEVDLALLDPSTMRLIVTDTGVGIPLEHREHLFNRFYQAHGAGYLGGLGLGLYVSRQIVQLHSGEIRAEFPEDGGTRFVVLLPTVNP